MWLGESQHTVDAKNRVFLPKRFLSGLERSDVEGQPKGILTRGFEGCLFLFSQPGFQRAVDRLEMQPFAREDERLLQRLFFSHASEVQLDAQGRLLLPEKLKAIAGIAKDVVIVGLMERIEIWAKERWTAFEERNSSSFDRLDGVLLGNRSAPNGHGGDPA